MAAASKELLEDLHNAVVLALLTKVKGGEATAADLNVARAMLRDNHIESIGGAGSPLGDLLDALPDEDEGDEINLAHYR